MRKRKGNNDLEYFTWDYIMSQTDSDGDVPGTFMACSRVRGPGKTYDIGRQMLKQRLGHPCKLAELIGTERLIGLIVRTKGAIGHTAQGVFGAVLADHYEGSFLKEIGISKAYSEIHWIFPGDGDDEDEDILLGYVIALNGRDEVKTNS